MKRTKQNPPQQSEKPPSKPKTSTRKNKRHGRGFSLIELVIVVAIMAILTTVLAPSLLSLTERAREQRDMSAMNEVTNAVLLAMTNPDIYDELVDVSLPENVSCYIDTQFESDHTKEITSENAGTYDKYTFGDNSRITNATQYYAAGNMIGATITFKPNANSNTYVLSEGIINKFLSDGTQKVSDLPFLSETLYQILGNEIELKSQAYRNSEYTIFVKTGASAGQVDMHDAITAYGQFSGTHLTESDTTYYVALGRNVTNPTIGTNPNVTDINTDVGTTIVSTVNDQSFSKESPTNLTLTSTEDLSELQGVMIDGKAVDSSHYVISEDSSTITLMASYLITLEFGEHTVVIVFNDGASSVRFEITDSNDDVDVCQHNHTVVIDRQAATCTSNGYTGDQYCNDCNMIVQFGDVTSYLDHTSGQAQKENIVAATCCDEGSYDMVTRCTTCNAEISRTSHTVPTEPHKESTKNENVVAASCSTAGSYDVVTYCTECNTELNRQKTAVPTTQHTEATKEANRVAATCSKEGSYDIVTYCSVCNKELNRTKQSVAKLSHTTASKKENEIAATCTSVGTYDAVTYCTVCNAEISRRAQTTAKLDHTSATKTENNVAATCSKAGSYDTVTYCKVCNFEINRVTSSVPTIAHTKTTKTENNVAATCTKDGSYETVTSCTVCKAELSRVRTTVPKTGHVNTVTQNVSAIYSGDVYCNTCKTVVKTGTYSVTKKSTLNDYSWLEIQYLSKSGASLSTYNIKIGDKKTDGGKTFVLVDDSRDGYYGGLVFMFNSGITSWANNGNSDGYANTPLRTKVDALYDTLSPELQSAIKPVTVACNKGLKNYWDTEYIENAKLFLPSVREAGGRSLWDLGFTGSGDYEVYLDRECAPDDVYVYEDAVFAFFAGEDADENRASLLPTNHWWFRSANGSTTDTFWCHSYNWEIGIEDCETVMGVVPAFVVG